MIDWKEEAPDLRVIPFSEFPLHRLNINYNEFINYLDKEYFIFFCPYAWDKMWKHGRSSFKEVGGLLIGFVYKYKDRFIWYIDEIVFNNDFEHSFSHVILYPSLWQDANAIILNQQGTPEKFILGWYHTHPRFTPFFSSTDQNTHTHFFNFDYSLGIVFDPYSEQILFYVGGNTKLYTDKLLICELFKKEDRV